MVKVDKILARKERVDVLPTENFSLCGFSSVHGDKIAVFDLYLDESGTHSKRTLVVGGILADVNKWAELSAQWKIVLDEYRVSFFHTKTFRSKESRSYAHLSRANRRDMLAALIHTIRENSLLYIASALSPEYYESVTSPRFRSNYGSAYCFAIQGCLIILHSIRVDLQVPGELGIFLEDGHRNSVQALQIIKNYKRLSDPVPVQEDDVLVAVRDDARELGIKIRSYGLGSKKNMVPLQAADLIAYCVHGNMTSRDPFCNSVLAEIDKTLPGYGSYWKHELLSGLEEFISKRESQRTEVGKANYELKKHLRGLGLDVSEIEGALNIKQGRASNDIYRDVAVGLYILSQQEKHKLNL